MRGLGRAGRLRATLGVTAFAVVAASACGLEQKGQLDGNPGSGGAGNNGSGGTSVGGGACFPDSKVCKDPTTGEPICFDADTPETGCAQSNACEPCLTPHATAKCETGACVIAECEPGYSDCNNSPIDGCESNTNADPLHCGDCANDCTVTPKTLCKDGECAMNDCVPPTLLDCDLDPGNGCEVDGMTDPNNCLYCGKVCDLPNAVNVCVAQACAIGSCNPGYADCDQNPANGCETHTEVDPDHCGLCENKCPTQNGAAQCDNSVCDVVCSSGYADCDSTPGCETDAETVAHCGGCSPCAPQNVGNAKCPNGTCDYDSCKSGFDDCDGNTANGCEVSSNTDNANCGNCGTVCSGGRTCQNGQCKCTTGFDCGSAGCRACCADKDCGGGGKKCCNYQCQSGSC